VGVVVLAIAIAPRASAPAQPVTFSQAQAVISLRCVPCHSATPTQAGFSAAPNGVMFDQPEVITGRAAQIYQRAVVARDMPLGNLTGMTQEERAQLGAWFEQGAPGP
jgi:uncharacterized membrane protein